LSRIIDISLGLGPDLLPWPGDPPVEVLPLCRIADGGPANVSQIRLTTHTGTHVDPPAHFIEGAPTVDELALDALVGEAFVADLATTPGLIGAEDLDAASIPRETRRLLLKTPNSAIWRDAGPHFPKSYASLSPEGARWVIERGIRLLGTDFLSIEMQGTPGHPTHHALLEAGVVIVEGLDLYGVTPGAYTLACLPLKVLDGDGAPARAVLIDDQGKA
jgi:arylformamidase